MKHRKVYPFPPGTVFLYGGTVYRECGVWVRVPEHGQLEVVW